MEDDIIKFNKKYLKNLALLNIQKKEIEEILKNPIKIELDLTKLPSFYFINKDIIDLFLSEELNKVVVNCIDTYKNNNNINSYIDFHNKEDDCIKYINNKLINNNFDYNK